jgi:peptide/nickel transport system permease protein
VTAAHTLGKHGADHLPAHLAQHPAPILTQVALGMASAVFLEAGLSFLGLGAQPPAPSWGSMLRTAETTCASPPGMASHPGGYQLFMLGLNMLADGLRDALDPTRARSG